jgi:ATP-binding protein involved in chromosome partitioning
VIDIFSKGGVERTAQQFKLPFLGSVELDPNIRQGGDRGLPVALAPEASSVGTASFYGIARKLMERAEEQRAHEQNVFEIT